LVEYAPAKVNLTLRVVGRRSNGYHAIESMVAFARVCDRLALIPGGRLRLTVRGPMAARAGRLADNLVVKAARALAAAIPRLKVGQFILTKHLPVAAGLGGGSADAAAALRLLARANRLKTSDQRIRKVARALGADVPICLDPCSRIMRGIGEILSKPIRIPKLPAVLVNPGAPLATRDVFSRYARAKPPRRTGSRLRTGAMPRNRKDFIARIAAEANDLEPAAIALAPVIANVLAVLRECAGCELARMSGAGATCFGLFSSQRAAASAARRIAAAHPRWWVRASTLR